MRWGVLGFYAACVRRAFSGWFGKISGWAGTLSLLIGVILLFVKVPPKAAATVAQISSQAEPAFFLVAFAAILVSRLLMAPYWLFREELLGREALETAAIPCLTVALPNPPVVNSVALGGSTSESLAGTRQTITNRWELDVVALTCVNEGTTEAQGCRARLLSAYRMDEPGATSLGVVEAVSLPWDKHDTEGSLVADIPPSETRHIWLGGVRSRGHLWIFRDIKALPLDYQQLLGEPGTYRVLIQVDARNVPPQQIALEIVAAEGPSGQHGIQRGTIDIRMIAKGAPRLDPDAWRGATAANLGSQ